MRLNRVTLLILGVCIFVIALVTFFREPLTEMMNPPTATPLVHRLLPDDIVSSATSLTIQQGADFVQIDKIDGTWQIVDGTQLDSSAETYSDFVTGIVALMLEFDYATSFSTDDLKQYGLDESPNHIILHDADTTYDLLIGNKNPDGNRFYVRFADANQIYLVASVFEIENILKLPQNPPYQMATAEVTAEASDNSILFPDVFGYQIASFEIHDNRDASWIRYKQGDQGTWSLEGTYVNPQREVNHVLAAVDVSKFLFLKVQPSSQIVRKSVTDISILTLSMTSFDEQTYTMYVLEPVGDSNYLIVLGEQAYIAPATTVNQFIDMIHQPPYVD